MADKFRPLPDDGAYHPSSYERDEWQSTLAKLKEPTMSPSPNTYRFIAWIMLAFCVLAAIEAIWWLTQNKFDMALTGGAISLFCLFAAFLNDLASRRPN